MARQTPPPNVSTNADQTLMDVLEQNIALEAQLADMRAQQTATNATIEAVLVKQQQMESTIIAGTKAARVQTGDIDRSFPAATIDDFLKSTRPDSEFFIRPMGGGVGHFWKRCLQHDITEHNEHTKQSKLIPALWIEATLYHGPGSEFRDPRTLMVTKWGVGDLSMIPNMTITHEDITIYNLLPHIRPVKGHFDLTTMINRLFDPRGRDITRGDLLTGAEFQAIMRAKYEELGAKRARENRTALALAGLKDGRQAKFGVELDGGLGQVPPINPTSPLVLPRPRAASLIPAQG